MQTLVYKNTTIRSNTAAGSVSAVEYAARFAAADFGLSLIEAYCLIKGVKVTSKVTSKETQEAVKAAVKVAHPTKLRATKKAHKRHKRAGRVARATTILFTAPAAVDTTAHTRELKARLLWQAAVQKTARTVGLTYKEVLSLSPRDIVNTETGEALRGFRTLLSAFRTVKALMA